MAATKSVKLMLIAAMALIVICSSLAESASVQHHHHHLNHQRLARSSVPAKDKEVSLLIVWLESRRGALPCCCC